MIRKRNKGRITKVAEILLDDYNNIAYEVVLLFDESPNLTVGKAEVIQ